MPSKSSNVGNYLREGYSLVNCLLAILLVAALRLWKLAISPWMGSNCRFSPTCSDYAAQSIRQHGVLVGTWLSVKRILRCNSLNSGGYDPVTTKDLKEQLTAKRGIGSEHGDYGSSIG